MNARTMVVDGLIVSKWDRSIFEDMHAGGLSAANCTVSIWENFRDTVTNIAKMKRLIRSNSDLVTLVRTTDDINAAAQANKTGIIFGFQNAYAFEDDLGTIESFWDMGVRVVQLCYNTQNLIGTGCYERDGGLSGYGREVVVEMNRVGIMIDLSHVGPRTSEDAILESTKPVCYSHCAPAGLKEHPRNKSDEQLRSIAARGGLIGVTMLPAFLRRGADASVDDYVEAIEYVVNLVGEDCVGYGSDFMQGYDQEFLNWVTHDKGRHRRLTDVGPMLYPAGIGTIRETPNIRAGMERAGWKTSRIEKILGLNWCRVYRDVWGA